MNHFVTASHLESHSPEPSPFISMTASQKHSNQTTKKKGNGLLPHLNTQRGRNRSGARNFEGQFTIDGSREITESKMWKQSL